MIFMIYLIYYNGAPYSYPKGSDTMISAVLALLESDEQRSALAEFYARSKNRLYYIALSKLHNSADAEDAVQEVSFRG